MPITRFSLISFTRFVKHGLALCAVGFVLALSGAEAGAQTKGKTAAPPSSPSAENKTFEDWGYTCEQHENTKKCYVFQNQEIQGKGRLIRVSIGNIGPKNEMMLVIQLPLGINLEQGGPTRSMNRTRFPSDCVSAHRKDAWRPLPWTRQP